MDNWMDKIIFSKSKKRIKKRTTKQRRTKGGWNVPLLTSGKSLDKSYVEGEYREVKEEPYKGRRTTTVSSSRPSSESYEVSYKVNEDVGSPFTGSKAYKKQIEKQRDKEKKERQARERELKRQTRIRKDIESAEVHQASAKKFEALARERKAKAVSRRRSVAGQAGRTLYSLINPYSKKPRRRKPSKGLF